ncbi:MAG: SDR family oxidoreductase [Candidatus Eisenbacteria bacterium]|nr:SDR family oxidoreductase [Candidatus Eisenbacteria bacterium]
MDLGLKGKRALVTASSKGIGRACALELAREGADVAICARGAEALEAARRQIVDETGRKIVAVRCDLSFGAQIEELIEKTSSVLGGLDVLVTNAGGPPSGHFMDFDDEAWMKTVALNLMSVVRLNRSAVSMMRKGGGGAIINLTSISVKEPIKGLVLSNAVRAGVVGLSKTLANELGPESIRVNVVCPGYTATDRMTELMSARAEREGKSYDEIAAGFYRSVPLGRFADPADIARMVTFLASDAARYVTGVTVQVDGGTVRGLL